MIVIARAEDLKLIDKKFKGQIIITGVGAANVSAALMKIPRGTKLTNIGYADAVGIEPGTQVKVGTCQLHHPHMQYGDVLFELNSNSEPNSVLCYTSTDAVLDAEEGAVYDTELAFIMAMGFTNVTSYKITRAPIKNDNEIRSL